ncbi:hypothetical protein BH09BAC5_BH09BAC5_20010 [soil metagenome]
MNLPPLSKIFPNTETFADLYGGWTEGKYFKKVFVANTLVEQIKLVNDFLKVHEFNEVLPIDAFEETNEFEGSQLSFHQNVTGLNQIMLVYHQPLARMPMEEIVDFLNYFREQRDWEKFHDSKNLSMAIGSEAGELLDLFLWDRTEKVDYEKVENELADIVTYCIYMAENIGVDLLDAVIKKAIKNNEKYPVEKSKGTAKKYDEL